MVNGKVLAGSFVLVMFVMAMVSVSGCLGDATPAAQTDNTPKTAGGVTQAQADVYTDANGLTVDQAAVKKREEFEADPNKLKYIIIYNWNGNELYTGIVDGKVHSSGRSLTPQTVAAGEGYYTTDIGGHHYEYGIPVEIPTGSGKWYVTSQVMADDGTYGTGGTQYIYWWDPDGNYYQQSLAGGVDYLVSSQPVHMKDGKLTFTAQ